MGSRSRKRQDRFAVYVIAVAAALVVVAAGVLAYALTRGKSASRNAPAATANAPALVAPQTSSPAQPSATAAAPLDRPPPTRTTNASPAAPAEVRPIALRSDDLRQQYAMNESAVMQRFRDRPLEVTGTVTLILQESPLVGICFGSLQDPVPPLLCEVPAADLTGVRPGQTVTVRGVFTGPVQGGFLGLGKGRVVSAGGEARP